MCLPHTTCCRHVSDCSFSTLQEVTCGFKYLSEMVIFKRNSIFETVLEVLKRYSGRPIVKAILTGRHQNLLVLQVSVEHCQWYTDIHASFTKNFTFYWGKLSLSPLKCILPLRMNHSLGISPWKPIFSRIKLATLRSAAESHNQFKYAEQAVWEKSVEVGQVKLTSEQWLSAFLLNEPWH